jgi:hypothetical protein
MNSPDYIELLRNGRTGFTKLHTKDILGIGPEFQIYIEEEMLMIQVICSAECKIWDN